LAQPRAHQPGIGRIGQVQGAEQDDQVAQRRRLGGGAGGVQGSPGIGARQQGTHRIAPHGVVGPVGRQEG
jgi:hypothetical protein